MDTHTQANQNTLSFDKNDTAVCKGIAIILLLFHHLCGSATYFSESFLGITDEVVMNTIIDAAQDARVCVWIFAFLSAYGLSSKYYKHKDKITVSTFLYKQWFSLMKSFWFVYICVFTFYFFIAKISALEYYDGNVLVALLDFFGVADIFETKMLSGVWWYMCFAQILL